MKKKLSVNEKAALEETVDLIINELVSIKSSAIDEIIFDVKKAKKLNTSHNRESRLKLSRLERNIKNIRLALLDVWKLSNDNSERMKNYNKKYKSKNDNNI